MDNDTRIADLEADNRRLRRLLDQRGATGELRHRLRGTLSLLRTIIRRSAETRSGLDDYVGHLEDRLDAIARAQAVTDDMGAVPLHTLLADELLHYGASEGDRVRLSGPSVHLQPRAGQVMALALHELAVNAVEHGVLVLDTGTIAVTWQSADGEPEPVFTLIWKERGARDLVPSTRHGFGTDVLTRMLAYALKATTALEMEPDGLRCTIRFPFPASIGWIEPD